MTRIVFPSESMPKGYGKDLSTVQRKMLAVLSDGLPHTRAELHACLWDQDSPLSNIQPHITNLRKILLPRGESIICELANRRIYYRHVRLITSLAKD